MTELGHEIIGSGSERVVLLHGFTQSRVIWRDLARRLVAAVDDIHCLLVDLPGHGDSAGVPADIEQSAQLVTELGGKATYVGYSLGGRVLLQAAVSHPNLVRRLATVSATAGIEDDAERADRARADDQLADRIELIGVDAFLDEWLAQPLFRDLPDSDAQRVARAANSATGLADSLRRCSQGRQRSLWNDLRRLQSPLLAVAGSRDTKYVALARRLATTAPHGSLEIIAGAGHSLVLERPGEFLDRLVYWMTSPNA